MIEPAYLILCGALVALGIVCTYGLRAYAAAAKAACVPSAPPETDDNHLCPSASVIIYSQSDEYTLEKMVRSVCSQDYPDFEIIVVMDAAPEQARIMQERMADMPKRVYVTYIQPGSLNLSRRKLALTTGLKAASGEVAVTTVANVSIPSKRWLALMLAPFCGPTGSATEVVLGVTGTNMAELHGAGKWYRQFDSLLTDALWEGYAFMGSPYRGDGANLALRRTTFFSHKGYASTINLHAGDDDLFIHEIATGGNTSLVAVPEARLTLHWGDSSARIWALRKAQYSFTSRWLPKPPFVRSAIMMGMQWLLPALCIAAAWLAWPDPISAVSAGLILLAAWGVEIYCYRRLATAYGAVRLWWAVVPFWMWRPIGDLIFRIDHRGLQKKNFTWQR